MVEMCIRDRIEAEPEEETDAETEEEPPQDDEPKTMSLQDILAQTVQEALSEREDTIIELSLIHILSRLSKLRVRIVSRNANDRFDENFWRRRVRYAWDYRKAVMDGQTGCCRLIFGEPCSISF